jgi:hypothetical protein
MDHPAEATGGLYGGGGKGSPSFRPKRRSLLPRHPRGDEGAVSVDERRSQGACTSTRLARRPERQRGFIAALAHLGDVDRAARRLGHD